ncbi:MAG: hypothetical protein EBY20_05755, partial [Alphaproteobacteria bacterium]|nr:hypothetical protein [Alphaproteobacteria bacterium]
NGLVIEGSLQFSIASKLGQNITDKIAKIFKQKLEEVINWTVKQTRSYLTASDVGNIINQAYLDRLQRTKEIEGVYLANSLQQGFIYHALSQGDIDDAYRVQLIWEYGTNIDISRLREAWSYAQKKYPSLRLRLSWEEELVQVIDKEGSLDWRYIDFSKEQDSKTQELKIKQIQENDRLEPYKLEQGNLFRVYLIKRRDDLYTCIFSNHHAILDGWSNPILMEYVHSTYLKLHNQVIIACNVDSSYVNSQKYLQENHENNRKYWDNYISQIEEQVDLSGLLSVENKRKNIRISEYKYITDPAEKLFIVENDLYYKLKEFGQDNGITLNAILQYVWHKTLSIYGNSKQTVVGTTVSGRNLPVDDIENSVGLYINTLPLIVNHENKEVKTVVDVIRNIQNDINEINNRSNIDLARLQAEGRRLFDSLFIYENYPNINNKEQENILRINFKEVVEKLDYPLAVVAYEVENSLILKLKYPGELFSREIIDHLLKVIKTLLEQVVIVSNQEIQKLGYLDKRGYEEIINVWNQTDKAYQNNKTIHELFEEQVERSPDSIAVVYGDIRLSYRELNARANRLAHCLLKLSDKLQLVTLVLDRSVNFLVSMLGVFKAGWSYLPIDPVISEDRILSIINESKVSIILSEFKYISPIRKLANEDRQIYIFEELELTKQDNNNPNVKIDPSDLAYVIYTSGSTGKPKGAMVEYRGMLNHLWIKIDDLKITVNDNIAQTATQSFDVSVWQFLAALIVGGTTTIFRDSQAWEPSELLPLIKQKKITIFQTVPSHMQAILEDAESRADKARQLIGLRLLVFSGEALSSKICSRWLTLYSNIPIINAYGPTECSDDVSHYELSNIRDNNLLLKTIPIGKVLGNCKIYILDNNLNLLPVRTVGELYIGGDGVGRGYLNRPELTAEKFIANPFQTKEERDDKKYGKAGRN